MNRYLAALGGAVLALLLGAGVAMAGEPVVAREGDIAALPPMTEPAGNGEWHPNGDSTVNQDNDNSAGDSSAGNVNGSGQANGQAQLGSGGHAVSGPATSVGGKTIAVSGDADGGDVSQSQKAANINKTGQVSRAKSVAIQKPPVWIVAQPSGKGDSTTDVSNSNTAGNAFALNGNATGQSNDQAQAGAGGHAVSGPATAVDTHDGKPHDRKCDPKKSELSSGKTGEQGSCEGGSKHPKRGPLAVSGDADGGDVDQRQHALNGNKTHQNADAKSIASQKQSAMVIAPAQIGSDGDDSFTQSNTNTAGDAASLNGNSTAQANDQTQLGYGGDAISGPATVAGGKGSGAAVSGDATGGYVDQSQGAANFNETDQDSQAESVARQTLPVVVYAPVRIGSDGDSSFTMSNTNTAGDAFAGNLNSTDQANSQGQGAAGGNAASGPATVAGGYGGGFAASGDANGGSVDQGQGAANLNGTGQTAQATSAAYQSLPIVIYAPVRIHSDGDDTFTMVNTNTAGDAFAGNANQTTQTNDQFQLGFGGNAVSGPATAVGHWGGIAASGHAYGGNVYQGQFANNGNHTYQHAASASKAIQRLAMFLAFGWGSNRLAA